MVDVATTYKVEWDRELGRRQRLGIVAPDPVPHPDHVVINYRTGEVEIKGPMTKEEKVKFDMFAKAKIEFRAELDELEELLRDEPDYQHRDQVLTDIKHNKKLLEIIRRVIPD